MGQRMGFYEDDLLDPFYDFCDKKRKEHYLKLRTLWRGKKRDRRALWASRSGAKTRRRHPLKLTRKEQFAPREIVKAIDKASEQAKERLKKLAHDERVISEAINMLQWQLLA